jgi:hypothetical protein
MEIRTSGLPHLPYFFPYGVYGTPVHRVPKPKTFSTATYSPPTFKAEATKTNPRILTCFPCKLRFLYQRRTLRSRSVFLDVAYSKTGHKVGNKCRAIIISGNRGFIYCFVLMEMYQLHFPFKIKSSNSICSKE